MDSSVDVVSTKSPMAIFHSICVNPLPPQQTTFHAIFHFYLLYVTSNTKKKANILSLILRVSKYTTRRNSARWSSNINLVSYINKVFNSVALRSLFLSLASASCVFKWQTTNSQWREKGSRNRCKVNPLRYNSRWNWIIISCLASSRRRFETTTHTFKVRQTARVQSI